MFDLVADPAAIIHAFKSDAMLAPHVRRRTGVRIVGVWDPLECAASASVLRANERHDGPANCIYLNHKAGTRRDAK